MFAVTDAAAAHCAQILDDAQAPEGACVRIVVEGDGVALVSGRPDEDDALFKHEERVVLVADKNVQAHLEGATLDRADSAEGPRLTLG